MSVGERIRTRRKALKLTQQELASAIGLTPQHISAIEQDKRAPSLQVLAKMAEELGVTVDFIVAGNGGNISDIIPAIKADKTLGLEAKKALITLVRTLRNNA